MAQTTQWGPGRLELFDIESDPGQERNLTGEHPGVVERLMGEYETWWDSVSERFGDVSPIHIGGAENPVKITCHAWHGEKGLYNQWHVRPGIVDNGHWPVEVVTPGEYEFRLCRWPEEANAAIRAPLPPRRGVPFVDDLVPGEALSIVNARLRIGDVDAAVPVGEQDMAAVFRVSLPVGGTRLETFFTDEDGNDRGAYYVYVRRTGS